MGSRTEVRECPDSLCAEILWLQMCLLWHWLSGKVCEVGLATLNVSVAYWVVSPLILQLASSILV